MKSYGKIATILICILCIGAIVYFVFFFGGAKNENEVLTTIAQKEYEISFDTDILEYDVQKGFMDGVKATDENGNDLTSDVTVSCKPTSNIAIKELTYSVNKAGYALKTYTRKLRIGGEYTGPTITVSNENMEIPLNEVANLSSVISRSNYIDTDDGFGRKCSISAEFSTEVTDIGDYVITITAENLFGDTKSVKTSITVTDPNKSIIKLTTTAVTINVGDKFDPAGYIKSANHEELGDISSAVTYTSTVDTSTPGQYTVTYSFGNIADLKNETATLVVTVK